MSVQTHKDCAFCPFLNYRGICKKYGILAKDVTNVGEFCKKDKKAIPYKECMGNCDFCTPSAIKKCKEVSEE